MIKLSRSQAEMSHTCRGTINLAGAFIVTEESTNFTVSNGGTQTFHLKANHEVERQRLKLFSFFYHFKYLSRFLNTI